MDQPQTSSFNPMTILTSVVVAALVIGAFYWYFNQPPSAGASVIHTAIQDGKSPIQSKRVLQRSNDQPEGLTFSYTCWLRVDNFEYRYGEPKVVFVKGSEDLKVMCPALLIDANTNSLLLKMDTFGAQETVSIPNIPAKKWMHIAIAVDQDSVDIYINGTLYTHHTLAQVPKQNNMPVHTSVGGGFDGKIANLVYYSYYMTNGDVQKAFAESPQPSAEDAGGPVKQYFDMTWWTGRRS